MLANDLQPGLFSGHSRIDGKDRGNHEIDRDDPVGGKAEIFHAQIVLANGQARQPEFGPEQNGRGDTGKTGRDDRNQGEVYR